MSEPSVDAILTEEGPDALQQMTETCHDCGNHDKCQAQRAAEAEVAGARVRIEQLEARVAELEDDRRELMRDRSD